MLPIALLSSAKRIPILVEIKNGETFNGTLSNCDVWMNLHLVEVVQTAADGERFFNIAEAFIRGSTVKYIRLPEEIMEGVKDINAKQAQMRRSGTGRGSAGGRGASSRGSSGPSSRGRGSSRGGRGGDAAGNRGGPSDARHTAPSAAGVSRE